MTFEHSAANKVVVAEQVLTIKEHGGEEWQVASKTTQKDLKPATPNVQYFDLGLSGSFGIPC